MVLNKKQINETVRHLLIIFVTKSFVFSSTHVIGYIYIYIYIKSLFFTVCWWLACKTETCSRRLKVHDILDCYIYIFLLCCWFFSYLTTPFWLQVQCSVESYPSFFILDITFFFSVIIISSIFIITTTSTIIIYVHLNKNVIMFALPSPPPFLYLLVLSTSISISYIIIFISLSLFIIIVFVITFLFILFLLYDF